MHEFTATSPHTLSKAEADLEKSGISLQLAYNLGIDVVPENSKLANGKAAIVFPYWDPFVGAFTPLADFYRAKVLSTPQGFAGQTKQPKYIQPAGSLNGIYVPRLLNEQPYDWKAYLQGPANPAEPLYITEGEKKAIAGCNFGYRTLGLGGVDMFRAQRRGIDELPILGEINFKNRLVYIVFDTDPRPETKQRVQQATIRLMDYLVLKGATPAVLMLKSELAEKVGLDDYLLTEGPAEFRALHSSSVNYRSSVKLAKAASKVVYVQDPGFFYLVNTAKPQTKELINNLFHLEDVVLPRPAIVNVPGVGKEERIVPKVVPIADALLMYGNLRRYAAIAYRPGEPLETRIDGEAHYNLWQGWKCEYENGNHPTPTEEQYAHFMREWNWALDNVFGDDPVAAEFIRHWIYYPIKFPGTKLFTFCLICSKQQGIGKSFIGDMLAEFVYGIGNRGHAAKISEGQLSEQFNDYMAATSLVVGDDIAAHDKNSAYAKLKHMVTSSTISINSKGIKRYDVENRANLYITSNDLAPFALDIKERRVFGHVPRAAIVDNARYKALYNLFRDGVGGPCLLLHARTNYAEGAFNPNAPAPETTGKQEIESNSRSDIQDWVSGLIAAASDGGLTRNQATSRELRDLLLLDLPYLENKVTEQSLGKALAHNGLTKLAAGRQLPVPRPDGTVRRERVWNLTPEVSGRHSTVMDNGYTASLERMLEAIGTKPLGYLKAGKVLQMKKY